jgi:hypothetical protein
VARLTLVGIEAGTEPIVAASRHGLDFSKPDESVLKERGFVRGKARQRIAGTGSAAPHAEVYRSFSRLSRHANARCCQDRGNELRERFEDNSLSRSHQRLLNFPKENLADSIRI